MSRYRSRFRGGSRHCRCGRMKARYSLLCYRCKRERRENLKNARMVREWLDFMNELEKQLSKEKNKETKMPEPERLTPEEAKPCPFCGRQPQLSYSVDRDSSTPVLVSCPAFDDPSDDGCLGPACVGENREKALEVWNLRGTAIFQSRAQNQPEEHEPTYYLFAFDTYYPHGGMDDLWSADLYYEEGLACKQAYELVASKQYQVAQVVLADKGRITKVLEVRRD